MQPATRRIVLKLYVTGRNSWAEQSLARLRELFEAESRIPVETAIIDVLNSPDVAEANRIIATPTLVKEYPLPSRKIIGDLADLDRVITFLGLRDEQKEDIIGIAHADLHH